MNSLTLEQYITIYVFLIIYSGACWPKAGMHLANLLKLLSSVTSVCVFVFVFVFVSAPEAINN